MNQRRFAHHSAVATIAGAVALLLLAGCVQPMTQQGVPDDFSLDVAILPESGSINSEKAQHFILHADGSLRAGRGRQGAPDSYAGQARKLSAAQMAELLNLARQAIAAVQPPDSTVPRQWLHEEPPAEGTAMLLWVRDSGEERAARFDSSDGALPPAANRVHQRLRELALMR